MISKVVRFNFSNQIEKHYPDGTKEIIFPDQTVKYLYTSGAEECVFTDGTVERISVDGERIVEFPNGQRETYTKLFKVRQSRHQTVYSVVDKVRVWYPLERSALFSLYQKFHDF